MKSKTPIFEQAAGSGHFFLLQKTPLFDSRHFGEPELKVKAITFFCYSRHTDASDHISPIKTFSGSTGDVFSL